MELSVAQYLVAVTPKPAMFIIDCNPNMVGYPSSGGVPDIYTRTVPLVEWVKPVVFMSLDANGTSFIRSLNQPFLWSRAFALTTGTSEQTAIQIRPLCCLKEQHMGRSGVALAQGQTKQTKVLL